MAPSRIRLGTASPGTQPTTAETLAQLEGLARRAASKNIDILLLPEAYIGGYPRGTHFGCLIGSRSDEGRQEFLRYFQSAVDLGDTVGDGAGAGQAWVNRELPSDAVPGSDGGREFPNKRGDGTREELERIARETRVFIVVGLIEKTGGSMYCSVVYVCPDLGVIGKRRKVMPTGTERLVWAQGSPATLRAVSTTIRGVRINLAAAICWENYMPLVRQALYSQNINLYLAPTADGRDTWLSLLRTAAIEGRCFVISSNMCTRDTPSPPTNGHTALTSLHDDETDGSDIDPLQPLPQHHRRNSCLTKEGFEIALPNPPHHTTSPSHHHRRRQSILDDDGNEIALPCSPSPPPPPPPQHHPHHRRQSVFDEDGNEIALPCPPPSSHDRPPRRRQSVFDSDGNEIVLCGSSGGGSSHPHPTKKTPTTAPLAATKPVAPASTGVGLGKAAATSGGGFTSRGGSAIVSPFGDVLAGPQWEDDQGIVYADVDFEDCVRGRLDLDAAGSYSRNDSFRLEVRGLDLGPLPY